MPWATRAPRRNEPGNISYHPSARFPDDRVASTRARCGSSRRPTALRSVPTTPTPANGRAVTAARRPPGDRIRTSELGPHLVTHLDDSGSRKATGFARGGDGSRRIDRGRDDPRGSHRSDDECGRARHPRGASRTGAVTRRVTCASTETTNERGSLRGAALRVRSRTCPGRASDFG